jgi:hypothetical protein
LRRIAFEAALSIEAFVAGLSPAQRARAPRAAEMLGHAWVAHKPLERRQIAGAPRF